MRSPQDNVVGREAASRALIDLVANVAWSERQHVGEAQLSRMRDEAMVKKLFDTLAPRYKDRSGGYTRVLKAGYRYGDSAPVAVIEFVDRDESVKGKEDKERHEAMKEAAGA